MTRYPRVLTRRPRHRSVVERPRLSASESQGHITVLIGPSGSGKSVLAGQMIDATEVRTAWCRLAPGWNRATDIVGMTASSLGLDLADPGDDLHAAADTMLSLLESEPTLVVIDDLHEAEGSDAEQLLAEVASFLPDNAGLILTSQRRPTELIGLVDSSVMRVIEGADLAFDPEEAATLFAARGLDVDAEAAVAATNGWAAAIAASGDMGDHRADGVEAVIATALSPERLGDLYPVAQAAAVLPHISGALLIELDLGNDQQLAALAARTSLLTDTEGVWRLHSTAAEHLAGSVAPADADELRTRAAHYFAANDDAITAIELFIAAGLTGEAGSLLGSRASEIGPARATRWLYQLPADVRRSLPPVLAAGRATVNVNLAIETARRNVEGAADPRSRRESLLGLGSLLLAEGSLGEAAEALEAAVRLAGDDHRFATTAAEQLGLTRWLAGDQAGARAAVANVTPNAWIAWLLAAVAFLDGDLDTAAESAQQSVELADGDNVTEGPGGAMQAAVQLVRGDLAGATTAAEAAYELTLDVGGRDLGAAAPVHGWCLIRSGDIDGALVVADQLERTIGRHDEAARLHTALLRRAALAESDDETERQRSERRVADLRSRGFAPIEHLAGLLADAAGADLAPSAGLRIEFCRRFRVLVDGTELDGSAWKSKKAQEVCALLCHRGETGLRREQVIEAVWEGRDPDKGRTLLRTALSEIRRVLEPRRGAGQESRFVTTNGDRVVVLGTTDLGEAAHHRQQGDHLAAFGLLRHGLAPDVPDADWLHELTPEVERDIVETAARATEGPYELAVEAYEHLIDAEPWQKDHFDGLAAAHRAAGDDQAADDAERRWFADD